MTNNIDKNKIKKSFVYDDTETTVSDFWDIQSNKSLSLVHIIKQFVAENGLFDITGTEVEEVSIPLASQKLIVLFSCPYFKGSQMFVQDVAYLFKKDLETFTCVSNNERFTIDEISALCQNKTIEKILELV